MTTPPRGVSSAPATESHRTSAPGRRSTALNASRATSQPAASRLAFLLGGLATAGTMVLAGCSNDPSPAARPIGATPSLTPSAGQRVVSQSLVAKPTTLDLGGVTVDTWAYGDTAPGPLLRAKAGDMRSEGHTSELQALM